MSLRPSPLPLLHFQPQLPCPFLFGSVPELLSAAGELYVTMWPGSLHIWFPMQPSRSLFFFLINQPPQPHPCIPLGPCCLLSASSTAVVKPVWLKALTIANPVSILSHNIQHASWSSVLIPLHHRFLFQLSLLPLPPPVLLTSSVLPASMFVFLPDGFSLTCAFRHLLIYLEDSQMSVSSCEFPTAPQAPDDLLKQLTVHLCVLICMMVVKGVDVGLKLHCVI